MKQATNRQNPLFHEAYTLIRKADNRKKYGMSVGDNGRKYKQNRILDHA